MFFKPILETLFAISMAGAAVAAPAPEVDVAPRAAALPINYGKCYRIQTEEREFLRGRKDYWNYQQYRSLLQSDIYKICQHRVDGECQYDTGRAVNEEEDFFLWDFVGAGPNKEPNLVAANNPSGWFYTAYGGHKRFFHYNGKLDCSQNTRPCGIQTGGNNGDSAKGIAEAGWYPYTTRDESRRLLWYHEVECPEESESE